MDENLYDEFGNYIGPEIPDEQQQEPTVEDDEQTATVEAEAGERQHVAEAHHEGNGEAPMRQPPAIIQKPSSSSKQIVLHEDKKYYQSAEEVYGPDTEVLVQDEDTQPLEKPIIEPIKVKRWDLEEPEVPETRYATSYLVDNMGVTEKIRNVCFVGHLHHGKTSLMDMLVQFTHPTVTGSSAGAGTSTSEPSKTLRYTDSRHDEQRRGITIKSKPMSMLLPNRNEKHYLLNMMDTPGHVIFLDEISAAMRLCDGVVLVVDVLEGVMSETERAIRLAIAEQLPMVLVLNKMDRLILELKLPPQDAYHKIKHTINELNQLIDQYATPDYNNKLSPELGNVCFASTLHGWIFSLPMFAHMYQVKYPTVKIAQDAFVQRLWGDVYMDPETRQFVRKQQSSGHPQVRSFVQFVLEPLYKMYSHVVGLDAQEIQQELHFLTQVDNKKLEQMNVNPLLNTVFAQFFGDSRVHALVEMIAQHVPNPQEAVNRKIEALYTGPRDPSFKQQQFGTGDPNGPLMIHVTKMYHKPEQPALSGFDCLGRVLSGTVKRNQLLHIIGEHFVPHQDEEDQAKARITDMWLYQTRYRIPVDSVPAGNWVLLGGIDATLNKTATLYESSSFSSRNEDDAGLLWPLRPLHFLNSQPTMKIAVEPLNPSDLPKMVEGLRRISKSYPMAVTKVEESGEHTVLGTGELYLDCIMHDLRRVYAQVEIKVSDPVVSFCETIVDTSSIKCFAYSPNQHNKLTMIAEPMEKGLIEALEQDHIINNSNSSANSSNFLPHSNPQLVQHYEQLFGKFGWDALAVNSLWAFSHSTMRTNVLLNETFEHEVDPMQLNQVRDSVVQGFKWCTREGPLCDEPIRNTKFKLLDAMIAPLAIHRGAVQMIPTARRVCNASFLMATPRIMEPVYHVDVQAPLDSVKSVFQVLEKRRGHVISDVPKPGTPFYTIKALVPAMDSFGLETDVRAFSQGQAFCVSYFSHWSIVPGDPLDRSIVLKPLEPSPAQYLAREFMLKTRRRKGLSEDVSIQKYLDQNILLTLAEQGMMQQDARVEQVLLQLQ